MSITPLALKAYNLAAQKPIQNDALAGHEDIKPFSATLKESLNSVNRLRKESVSMTEAFASGENQNVHELMIALQKSSLAMNDVRCPQQADGGIQGSHAHAVLERTSKDR